MEEVFDFVRARVPWCYGCEMVPQAAVLLSAHDRYLENISADAVEPEISAALIEQETLDLLHAAIDELPEELRQVFELNFEQGLRNAEAARLMSLSLNGFNKRKAKMISLLRNKFHDNDTMLLFITLLMT